MPMELVSKSVDAEESKASITAPPAAFGRDGAAQVAAEAAERAAAGQRGSADDRI